MPSLGGGGNNNAKYDYHDLQISDDFDMVRGWHQITFGVDFLHQVMEVFNTQYSNGQMTFNGTVTGLAAGGLPDGRIGQLQQGADVRSERAEQVLRGLRAGRMAA